MRRTAFLVILAAFSLLAGAIAFGGGTGEKTPASGQPLQLRVSWWGGQIRHEATIKAAILYEHLHPNVKIVTEFSGWDGYFDKLTTQLAAKTAPDVFQNDVDKIPDYANRGLLLDLGPSIGGSLNIGNLNRDFVYSTSSFRESCMRSPWGWTESPSSITRPCSASSALMPLTAAGHGMITFALRRA